MLLRKIKRAREGNWEGNNAPVSAHRAVGGFALQCSVMPAEGLRINIQVKVAATGVASESVN